MKKFDNNDIKNDIINNMSKVEKLIEKILNNNRNISYEDAEKVLDHLGFTVKISSSHHIFRKSQYHRTISIKKRSHLLKYQVDDLKEVLEDHGHKKRN